MPSLDSGLQLIKSEGGASPNVNYLGSVQDLLGKQGNAADNAGSSLLSSGGSLLSSGGSDFNSGYQGLLQVLQHYQTLMNGSTDTLTNSLPEVNSVLSQYDAARKASAQTSPRGGMRASQGANLKFDELSKVGDLIQKARSGAAEGAASTAGALTNAGVSQEGVGLGQEGVGLESQKLATSDFVATMQSLLDQRKQNKTSAGSTFANEFAGTAGKLLAGALI